jgi:hypothetical protein
MADREFANRAVQLAAADIETNLINFERDYQDALRVGDEALAAEALKSYSTYKFQHDSLTGANQPRHQSSELSVAQRNFLSRRASLGDDLTPSRMKDYSLAHTRAVNAGLQPDSAEYFRAVERSVDTMGDGRDPSGLLDEKKAAKLCGVSDEVYAANAAKLRAMKARGEYS